MVEAGTTLDDPAENGDMALARPLPTTGSIFFDARGEDRALRVSWHDEADLVVVSLWRDNVCAAALPAGRRRGARPDRRAAGRARCGVRRRGLAATDTRPPATRRSPRTRRPPRWVSKSRDSARSADTVRIVDPIRNPYAPGAGQRPPELAGRDEQLRAFDVVLERVVARAARALAGADRAARRRQDGAAQRAALCCRTPPLGHRQARGAARPAAAPAAAQRPAPGGARARPPGRRTASTTCSG